MKELYVVIIMGLFFSCNPTKKSAQEDPAKQNSNKSSAHLISFEKGGCFGQCPIFKLFVMEDGNMQLEGLRFIDYVGPHIGQLDSESLKKLKEQIKTMAWDTYPEKYPVQISDFPSSTITYFKNGKKVRTKWSHDPAPELEVLGKMLQDIGLKSDWKKDPNQSIPENYIPTEIIVKLADVENLNPFLEEFKDYGLTMKEQLVPNMPMYNVYYDSSLAYPFEMLNLLKGSTHVKMAEFNKKVNIRN